MDGGGAHRGEEQCRRAARERSLRFRPVDELFAYAERRIALLGRCRPTNGAAALAEWLAAYQRGTARSLELCYGRPAALSELRAALERAERALSQAGPIGALYAARAAELDLEARLAERVGSADFHVLSRLRHRERGGPEWRQARRLAHEWSALDVRSEPGPRCASDDRRAPDSLVSLLAREIGRLGLGLRLVVTADLASRAACGDGVVYVRAGEQLSQREARRITAHELLGHALPRAAAQRHALGLLRVGSAGANDAEEGRALHIEARLGLLEAGRRRELAWRHLVALAVAGGADVHECVTALVERGCDAGEALAIYARVARGGGLCRELEYLPAWLRFSAAAERESAIAAWLSRGRTSLEAARVLHEEGVEGGADEHPEEAGTPRAGPVDTFSACQ